MKQYEIIDHTADIGIKVYGKDIKELFQNAACGMFNIIADLEGLRPTVSLAIKAEAPNQEELLLTWLDELIYNFYTKNIIFSEFNIKYIDPKLVEAEVRGKYIGDKKSRLKTEIKAVTYHELKIKETEAGYEAQVIFDV